MRCYCTWDWRLSASLVRLRVGLGSRHAGVHLDALKAVSDGHPAVKVHASLCEVVLGICRGTHHHLARHLPPKTFTQPGRRGRWVSGQAGRLQGEDAGIDTARKGPKCITVVAKQDVRTVRLPVLATAHPGNPASAFWEGHAAQPLLLARNGGCELPTCGEPRRAMRIPSAAKT